jgi:hypothetical protein
MKHPIRFRALLNDWMTMPQVIEEGIRQGYVAGEPTEGFVPLMGLSPFSDVCPPQAYANPGFAEVYNKTIQQFRRREAFSAFWSRISKAELEARLETYALLMASITRQRQDGGSTPKREELIG